MSIKKEIAIPRKVLLIGVIVLIVACLLLMGVRQCNPKGKGGEVIVLSPTPTLTRTWWQTQTPSPSNPGNQVLTLKARVTAEALNVREGPGSDYKIIGQVHRGDMVEMLAQNSDGSWYKIRIAELIGWVSATYVEMITQAVRPLDGAQGGQGSPQAVAMAPGSPEPTCLCPCPCTPTPTPNAPPAAYGTPPPSVSTEAPTPTPTDDACPPDICTPPVRIVTSTPETRPEPVLSGVEGPALQKDAYRYPRQRPLHPLMGRW